MEKGTQLQILFTVYAIIRVWSLGDGSLQIGTGGVPDS